jgi:hypothetical protein
MVGNGQLFEKRSTMRRTQRLIAASILVAFAGMLGGCSSGGGFDPTDLLDFLDTKKKLPGERKPVFPEGVPGLEQGVPKDLYKSEVEKQQQEQAQAAQAANAPPPAEDPKAKRASKSKKGKSSAAAASTAPAGGEAAPEEDATQAAPPAPKPGKIVRKRTTAPPPDASDGSAQPTQQSQGAFPAPVPSGSFTR